MRIAVRCAPHGCGSMRVCLEMSGSGNACFVPGRSKPLRKPATVGIRPLAFYLQAHLCMRSFRFTRAAYVSPSQITAADSAWSRRLFFADARRLTNARPCRRIPEADGCPLDGSPRTRRWRCGTRRPAIGWRRRIRGRCQPLTPSPRLPPRGRRASMVKSPVPGRRRQPE